MSETKICPYCGEEILAVAKKCKHCGEWLEEKKEEPKKQVPCEVCGEMIDEDALECPYCHEKVVSNVSETVLPPTVEYKQAATQYKVSGNPVAEQSKEDAQEQGGIFMHYFFDVIKNHYADFHRSVTRKEFWLFMLFSSLTVYALMCLALISFTFAIVVLSIYGLGVFIPSLAMYVCRLRDIGKKWTNLFFLLIPIVGPIILLVFFCTKGKKNNTGNAKMKTFDYVIIVLAIVGMIAYWGAYSKFMKNAFDDYNYYGYSSSGGSRNTFSAALVDENTTSSNPQNSYSEVEKPRSEETIRNIVDDTDISLKENKTTIAVKENKPNEQAITEDKTDEEKSDEETIIASSEEMDQAVEIKYVPVAVEEDEPEEQTIFEVVEQMPEFPDEGMQGLMQYLSRNIKYPPIAQENGTQGRVTVQFVVNRDGSIVDATVLRGVDPYLDKEAIRVISGMPKWKPGMQRGKPVRVKYTVPVMFRL